jgi:Uma2 family endonuclease
VPSRFKAEIIDGVLHVSPRPSSDHQYTNYALSFFVGGPHMFDPHGPSGWWILSEPGVRVQIKEEFAPDHAGWRKEKLPFLPSTITAAPDWVCEILSPGRGERLDRDTKMPFYARLGIEWLWLIDTVRRDVEVYRLVSSKYERLPVVLSDEARLPPFESLALPLSRFWP